MRHIESNFTYVFLLYYLNKIYKKFILKREVFIRWVCYTNKIPIWC